MSIFPRIPESDCLVSLLIQQLIFIHNYQIFYNLFEIFFLSISLKSFYDPKMAPAGGSVFVKVKKSTPSAQPSGQHPPQVGFDFNTISQLRHDCRIIAIVGLVHNQVLIFAFFYGFIYMARILKNTHNVNPRDPEFHPISRLIFSASLTTRAVMFVMSIVIMLLLILQQWTVVRLFAATDQVYSFDDTTKIISVIL